MKGHTMQTSTPTQILAGPPMSGGPAVDDLYQPIANPR